MSPCLLHMANSLVYPACCVCDCNLRARAAAGRLGKQAARIKTLRATNEQQQQGMQEQSKLLKDAQEDLATR